MGKNTFGELIDCLTGNPVIPCSDTVEEIFLSEYRDIKVALVCDLGIIDLMEIRNKNTSAKKYIILHIF